MYKKYTSSYPKYLETAQEKFSSYFIKVHANFSFFQLRYHCSITVIDINYNYFMFIIYSFIILFIILVTCLLSRNLLNLQVNNPIAKVSCNCFNEYFICHLSISVDSFRLHYFDYLLDILN